ncbi:DUF3558 family protein [Saccharopolyspora sp. ASAGF58]|uniref:DUF3558 family protein n=1 Tax=Saccharopolyspora sp. ASAGF58 TaxID=2719023 RepID=UPI00143FCC62|nr:DUF3558 family protein [Saccharopolyspora sp. ASAGF58]QIZ36289.1 DUF3558 domain-containing protein [Saccharopolyspora sp. ASAGF58]
MNALSRTVAVGCAGAAVLAITGCGGPTTKQDPAVQPQGLAAVDPCTLLTPDELKSFGFNSPGEPETTISSEPGCSFSGRPLTVTFYKNQEKTVEAYSHQKNWSKFDRLQIDGRAAASATSESGKAARICSAMFDAGGGVILVDVSEFLDQGLDECAEAVKVAQVIAPRMPR